jgi:acetolactate synthase I/II/III large subunit
VTVRLTGGEVLVQSLQRWDIDTIFGLPGFHLDHFFNALYSVQDEIQLLHTRHEQGAGYMALGYAMATGRPGVFTVVPGPGVLNTGAALVTAYTCNAPVLCITGTVPWALLDRQYGALHEIPDQSGILSRLTKWTQRVTHPHQIPELVDEAFKQLLSGRPRPVALEIPPEILGQSCLIDLPKTRPAIKRPIIDPEHIIAAAQLLANAKSPLIVVGGGAQHASSEVQLLAETLQAPVVSRQMGRGVLSDLHELAVPATLGNQLWKTADVVLGIGTRLQQVNDWGIDDQLKVIRVDLDPAEISRVTAPEIAIVADAAEAGAAICELLIQNKIQKPSVGRKLDELRKGLRLELENEVKVQLGFVDVIRQELEEDAIFVDELTQIGYVSKFAFPVYKPRSYICSGYQGTLGAGYATALGVQAAFPERKVLSINGDGGFMYNVQELSSAVLHNLPVVAVVFNDSRFGNVHSIQKRWYGGKCIATNLHNPDFVSMAENFGAMGLKVETPEQLRQALRTAFEHDGPVVIEVIVDIEEMGWPWSYILPRKVRS